VKTSTILRALWFAGGLALLLGLGRDTILGWMPRPRELPRFDGATGRPWVDDAFVRVGAYQEIGAGILPTHIQAVSSWLGQDEAQGRAESAWFKASRRTIHVGVAGYPQHPGCRIWVEFRAADGAITRVDCPLADPREQWGVWEVRRPAGAIAVRVVGEDRGSGSGDWIAFSHPFRAWPGWLTAAYQHLQIWTTLALVLTMIWGPGLWWSALTSSRCRVRDRNAKPSPEQTSGLGSSRSTSDTVAPMTCELRTVILLGAGPLSLATLGILIWIGSNWIRPQLLGLLLITLAWVALGLRVRRTDFAWPAGDSLRRVFAVLTLVVVAVVAKSFHSVGPEGELFRGTVSRNFEMADRIDSRYSFYVVQAAAHGWSPAAPETERFFFPWTFFSRGPLAGLVALPVVMATGGAPPDVVPENRWQPFDATGFAAYRLTLITLAGGVVVALFLVLAPLVGDKWAGIAAGLVALSPFGVHELMFTWPKWAATAWLIASFGLAHARRPLAAGLALGAGFLFHPLVLLWGPWLALWIAGRIEGRAAARVLSLARFGAGAALLVVPWMALGALMPHLPTTTLAGQGGFFRYFARADWHYATWDSWWHTRWMNFANTFIPLHGYLADASFNHHRLNSAYEASGRLVKFSQLWWNSLPFALGLGLWAVAMAAMVRAARAVRALAAAVVLFVFAPALLLTAYWGMDPLGLMRECGHPLLIAIVAIACVTAARHGGWLQRVLVHPAVPWLQLPETWLMLWLTTLLNPRPWAADCAHLDSLAFAISVVALAGAAWTLRRARSAWAEVPAPAPVPLPEFRPRLRAFATNPPAWLVLALGAIVLALRRPDQIHTPQFWAEDGIFFFQAHEIGLPAFGLELAGYSQLAPRVVAALSQLVDPAWAPHVFVVAGLALTLYVMSRALSLRCPLPHRAWAALAIVLVPDAAEVLLNANNIQWILACGGVLLLIARDPSRPAEWVHDTCAALFFGLTGPFSVLLAPFFVARAALRRTRASVTLAAIVAACALVQAASIVLHPQPPAPTGAFDAAAMAGFPGLRILGVFLLGAAQPAHLPWPLAIALTLALLGVLVFLIRRGGETRPLRLMLGLAFLAMLASTLYRCWHSMPLLCVPGAASRYVFPLQLLLLWMLLAMLRDRARWVRLTCAGAALWMVAVNLPRLRIAPVPDQRWADYAPKLRSGEEVTIPINPEGWSFTFAARNR